MKRLHVVLIVVFSLLLIASTGWGLLWIYATQDNVPGEVSVDGIALGEMKIDEALGVVDQYEKALLARQVLVKVQNAAGEEHGWAVQELGYAVQLDEVRDALVQLRLGGLWERAKYRYELSPREYLSVQSWDRSVFDAAVKKQWGWIDLNEPENATRTITDEDKVVYMKHTDAYRIDTGGLFAAVQKWAVLEARGDGLDVDPSLETELPVKLVSPEVTLERLKAEGIERKITEFTTDFSSSAAGRAYNVSSTARMLNDWHLAPDEVFDYGKLVRMTEEEYGYREAPVILNGKLVPGVGGGICQVSSTLYNAVLLAGLDIVERRNHSLPVAYLPKGQDATFASGAINFRWRNSTGKHLIVRTVVSGGKLTVKLFGTMPKNEAYEVESVTVKTIEPSVKEVASGALPAGQKRVAEQGKAGYVVETYRTLVRDGVKVKRERVSRDTYKAQPTVVEVGSGTAAPGATPSPAPAPAEPVEPLLEDGIGGGA
ncbi:VanW family protein [Paenibacillus sp. GCM10023252]|uniref:VanW family protein n=1 Tax=Paenibacillus sp. GCM10023252 TaxID=3252649 RepID=UPI0036213C6C